MKKNLLKEVETQVAKDLAKYERGLENRDK
jgi:hypothetical protein